MEQSQRSAAWGQLVQQLLPGETAGQARVRDAMQAVDRRHFVEPSTPLPLVYEVRASPGD